MLAAEEIEIRRLDATDVYTQLDGLAAVLVDCVAGGASVSYMAPFSHKQACGVLGAVAVEVEQHRRLLLGRLQRGARRHRPGPSRNATESAAPS